MVGGPPPNSGYTNSHLHLQTGSCMSTPSKQCADVRGYLLRPGNGAQASHWGYFYTWVTDSLYQGRLPSEPYMRCGHSCLWLAPSWIPTINTTVATSTVGAYGLSASFLSSRPAHEGIREARNSQKDIRPSQLHSRRWAQAMSSFCWVSTINTRWHYHLKIEPRHAVWPEWHLDIEAL